jgi:ADP-ribosylglycohydrolase
MKIKDGMIGLVVGDALGVPVEFKSREELSENPVTGMRGHGTYNMPKGTWSDDSSLAIATMQSIVNRGKIDYEDILREFSLYANEGKYTQYYTFDYGNTTGRAIGRFENGVEALKCGGTSISETTNGSLMRILPMAFIEDINYATVENVCGLTHGHEICKIACVLYIEIAKSMIENDLEISEHVERSCEKIKEYYAGSDGLESFQRILENDLDDVESSFYVVGTLECALHCLLTTSSYSEAVLKAVNFGNDADTVGAVCGGLAGIYYGFDDIPSEWIDDIPQIEDVIRLCGRFEDLGLQSKAISY